MMTSKKTNQNLQSLMASYVPEFSYEPEGRDPGSVLTTLCGEMAGETQERLDRAFYKHKIQFLNEFEALKEEPVSASRGYVQFQPVTGYQGQVLVPGGTQVMCTTSKEGELIYETLHDMSAVTSEPELVVITDRQQDKIVCQYLDPAAGTGFRGFDLQGENRAIHRLMLCFPEAFQYLHSLDLLVSITMRNEEEQEDAMELLASGTMQWSVMSGTGEQIPFQQVEAVKEGVHLVLTDYVPEIWSQEQKEGYYLVLETKGELPELYINGIQLSFAGDRRPPEQVFANGISQSPGEVLPFGKPLGLYHECGIAAQEVLSKKGARISIDFDLDYVIHQENIEIPEADLEYKVIMKKPKKTAELPTVSVSADYVVWEYLSRTGWKQLWHEEHMAALFNGTNQGHMSLSFLCPEDIETNPELTEAGSLRVRLLRADNIYRMPAVYQCPRIVNLQLSYSYQEHPQQASYALLENSFELQDITRDLTLGNTVKLFYNQEHSRRCMYLGFPEPISGSPVSIYFDLENYHDVPVDFTVEYLSDRGFTTVKNQDGTQGFLGSGSMLLMLPQDMKRTKLYGYEGYFIRFINYNPTIQEYALPFLRKIYMNMAKVINRNIVTEEFYVEDPEHQDSFSLSQENLLMAQVWVRQQEGPEEQWKLWESRPGYLGRGPYYEMDMADGVLYFGPHALANANLSQEGPHIRVQHANYTGAQANVAAGAIDTVRSAIRYISQVTNPFATYGGYDGYTAQSAERLVHSMLYTRNRAVTARDYYHMIAQTSFGVRRVKCVNDMDLFGQPKEGTVTVAVLLEEYEQGMQIFSERKDEIRERLLSNSNLAARGQQLLVVQPHFIKVQVRLWLERDTMEQAYELQNRALQLINDFIDPLDGGLGGQGWEIGEFPRASQIVAYLRTHLEDCDIAKILLTAQVDGVEMPVQDEFYETVCNPFVMAVNGEHIVYIDIV